MIPTSAADLWAELKRRRGAKTTRELARKLGIEQGDEERNFYRWVSAKRGSHESTVFALDALGFITGEGRAFLGLPDLPQGTEEEIVRKAQGSVDAARSAELEEEQRQPRRGAA